ncbi:MAG: hypothetical protein IJD83_06300, partial [Clostridia bacterium]|nr:hypothetical protein [Clostridia bacterium]
LKPEDSNNKYMPLYMGDQLNFEHSLGMNLYGLFQNKDAIREQRRVILVDKVMKSVGFSDYSHFSKYFKTYSGYSPKTFRRYYTNQPKD